MTERDERDRRLTDALRSAWSDLVPPEATPEATDPRTAACVAWMREAWAQLEPPPARVPQHLRPGGVPRFGPWVLPAAAALLLLFLVRDRGLPPASPDPVEELAVSGEPPAETIHREGDALVLERGSVRLLLLTPQTGVPGAEPNTRPETEDLTR